MTPSPDAGGWFIAVVGGGWRAWRDQPLFSLVLARHCAWLRGLERAGRIRSIDEAVPRVELTRARRDRRATGALVAIRARDRAEAHALARECPLLLLPGSFLEVRSIDAALTRARVAPAP